MQTTQDVITALTQIVEQCATTKNKAGYFAALYKRMTQAVIDNISAGNFEDGARMEKLDIVFAQRYIDAYTCYFSKTDCSLSWQTAFSCCNNNSLIVLQQLLLGINTHINLDLAIAAAIVAPGDSINSLHNDFNRINSLIHSLFADIEGSLAEVWPPMRMLLKIAHGKQDSILNFSIDKARDISWSNAVMLARMNDAQQKAYIHQMDELVCLLANKIKSPGIAASLILEAVRVTEYDDVARTIKLIDTTVVN